MILWPPQQQHHCPSRVRSPPCTGRLVCTCPVIVFLFTWFQMISVMIWDIRCYGIWDTGRPACTCPVIVNVFSWFPWWYGSHIVERDDGFLWFDKSVWLQWWDRPIVRQPEKIWEIRPMKDLLLNLKSISCWWLRVDMICLRSTSAMSFSWFLKEVPCWSLNEPGCGFVWLRTVGV